MAYKNNTQLIREQLGKEGDCVIFTTAPQTEDFYAVQFINESVVSAITVANGTGDALLQTTIPAGTVLFMNITAITLTSGIAVGYQN